MDLAATWRRPRVRLLVAIEVDLREIEMLDVGRLLVDRADDVATRPPQQHLGPAHVHRHDRQLVAHVTQSTITTGMGAWN
ncbi:MAG: hypothetical protein ACRD2C_26800 [Acidimicrobiales bacterium]